MKKIINLLREIKNNVRYIYYTIKYSNLKTTKSTIIQEDVYIDKYGKVFIGENTVVKRWSVINAMEANITIGNNCSINSFCHISGKGDIEIGNNVLIATHCVIISSNHIFDRTDIPIKEQGNTPKKIIIEDDVWLGAGVKVLAGITIGKGSVIGAGSVVTKDIPAYSIAVGVPAKVIKQRQ